MSKRHEIASWFSGGNTVVANALKDLKEQADAGKNIMPYKDVFRSYLDDRNKFFEEGPISRVKNMSVAQMKAHLNNFIAIFGIKRASPTSKKQNKAEKAIELGETMISAKDYGDLPELLSIINKLPDSVKSSDKIVAILRQIKSETGKTRLFFSKKQPSEAFMEWLAEQLDGVYDTDPFDSMKKPMQYDRHYQVNPNYESLKEWAEKNDGKNKPTIEEKASILFPQYNSEKEVVKAFNNWWKKIRMVTKPAPHIGISMDDKTLPPPPFSGEITPKIIFSIASIMKEGRPRVVGRGPITLKPEEPTTGSSETRQNYNVIPFNAIVLEEYIAAINSIPTSTKKDKGETIRSSIELKQFIPTKLPNGQDSFPTKLVFTSKNQIKISPIFEVMAGNVIGGADWFEDLKKLSNVQQIFSPIQVKNMIVGDLVEAYQNKEKTSKRFSLEVPILLTKKGERLEASNNKITEKMKDAIKTDSALSDAMTNTTINVADRKKLANTISLEEKTGYEETVNEYQLEDDFTFPEKKTQHFADRHTIRQNGKLISPKKFFEIFINRLREKAEGMDAENAKELTKKAKIYEKGQNSRQSLEDWLGNTSGFVESCMVALEKGHKMYDEVFNFTPTQSIGALTIENLLDVILFIDEGFNEPDPTTVWYKEIDSIFEEDLPPLEKAKPILEKIEDHVGKMLDGASGDFQNAFKKQLEGMIERWVEGGEYNSNHKAPAAVITKPMLDELEKKGFITKA